MHILFCLYKKRKEGVGVGGPREMFLLLLKLDVSKHQHHKLIFCHHST